MAYYCNLIMRRFPSINLFNVVISNLVRNYFVTLLLQNSGFVSLSYYSNVVKCQFPTIVVLQYPTNVLLYCGYDLIWYCDTVSKFSSSNVVHFQFPTIEMRYCGYVLL